MNYLNCIDKSYKPTIRFWKIKSSKLLVAEFVPDFIEHQMLMRSQKEISDELDREPSGKMKMLSDSKIGNSKFDDIIAAIISKSKDEMGEK